MRNIVVTLRSIYNAWTMELCNGACVYIFLIIFIYAHIYIYLETHTHTLC